MADIVERARAAQYSILPQPELIKEIADEIERLRAASETAADNAALIAAVPEMVAALQDIVKHMDGNGMQDWTVAKKARAVLASIGQTP